MIHFKEFKLQMLPSKDFCTTIFYIVGLQKITPNSSFFFNGEIHTVGKLTRSSGYDGYYSDKGQWFYENHVGDVIVLSSDEKLNVPKINLNSLDTIHLAENGKVYIELVNDPYGNIHLPGYLDTYSLKVNKFDNTVSVKHNFNFETCIL